MTNREDLYQILRDFGLSPSVDAAFGFSRWGCDRETAIALKSLLDERFVGMGPDFSVTVQNECIVTW